MQDMIDEQFTGYLVDPEYKNCEICDTPLEINVEVEYLTYNSGVYVDPDPIKLKIGQVCKKCDVKESEEL